MPKLNLRFWCLGVDDYVNVEPQHIYIYIHI